MDTKCKVDSRYSKDNDGKIYFYCTFCGRAMEHNEIRECPDNQPKVHIYPSNFI
jgi:aspartate carbamoyltransferase regulatory subunit